MKRALIFLNGHYPAEQISFYQNQLDSASAGDLVIAADGALNFFHEMKRRPSCVLGDFDSVRVEVLDAYIDLLRVEYPRDKDATDGELAIQYALNHECDSLDIYGAIDSVNESDQMLSNIFCLAVAQRFGEKNGRTISARIIDHRQCIYLLQDGNMSLSGSPGDQLSIITISETAKLTLRGTKWQLDSVELSFGSSRTLRNEFEGSNVYVGILGRAIVIHRLQ
jgi:thiamine pyrophosphokinase